MSLRLAAVAVLVTLPVLAGCWWRKFDYTRTTSDGMPPTPPGAVCDLPVAPPESVGLTRAALDSFAVAAHARMSDALVIMRNGRIVEEWYSGGKPNRINIQSVTKAISSLGVALLMDDGRIASFNLRLSDVFPEFASADKRDLTLAMLMNHTSGIAAGQGEAQFSGVRDVEAFVRAKPMAEPAGAANRYSNVNAQLAGAVVEARAGEPLARLVRDRVFVPLCIRDFEWTGDARGHTYAYSRLDLEARDLAKLGQLVLDDGNWHGQRVINAATLRALTGIDGGDVPFAAGSYTHFWQAAGADSVLVDSALLARVAKAGASQTFVEVLTPLATGMRGTAAFKARLDTALGADGPWWRAWRRETGGTVEPVRHRGKAKVILHSGSWGQYLVILPDTRTVAVRFSNFSHPGRTSEDDAGAWSEFANEVYQRFGKR